MFGLSSVYIFGHSSDNKFGPSSVNRLYEFEFFVFRLHLESDVSVGAKCFINIFFFSFFFFFFFHQNLYDFIIWIVC